MSSVAGSQRANQPRRLVLSQAVWQRLTPWLLLELALLLRLVGAGADGLRTDEMYSVWMANRPLPEMLTAIVVDGHDATPPTFYVLLHLVLQTSWELWVIRLVSIVSGALVVWLTFHLARRLFDFRIATLAALLVAVAPYSIDISQVARAYALSGLFAIASLYAFNRLGEPEPRRGLAVLYILTTVAALGTHYLAALVIIFQNLVVLAAFLLRQLGRQKLGRWMTLQLIVGVLSLPLIWMALQRLSGSGGGTGQDWLPAPSLTVIVKSLILWGTGDPSLGAIGFTLTRLASLAIICALLGLGALAAWRLWQARPDGRAEVKRIAYVAAAFFGIWGLALGISLQRKIFHEKYFIYLAPLLLVLLAWSGLRAQPARLGYGLLAALVVLTGFGLAVQYSEPAGEQWREAMAFVRQERLPGDYVVTTPGYYIRPASYYLTGMLPPADYQLLRAPFAIIGPAGFDAAALDSLNNDLPPVADALASATRVWLVTGYATIQPTQLDWFWDNYSVVDQHEFLGVHVVLGERGLPAADMPAFAPGQQQVVQTTMEASR